MIALSVGEMQDSAKSTKSLMHAKQIVIACKRYATEHEGQYPPSLEALVPKYLGDASALTSPFQKDQTGTGYEYWPGLTDKPPPNTVVVRDAFDSKRGRRALARADGSGEVVREK